MDKDTNTRQVGGDHYSKKGSVDVADIVAYAEALGIRSIQHWDLAVLFNWDPYQYQVTKYVMRHKDKNGLQDLKKGGHFLEKYIAIVESGRMPPAWGGATMTMIRMDHDQAKKLQELLADQPAGTLTPMTSDSGVVTRGPFSWDDGSIDFSEIAKPTMWIGYTFEGTSPSTGDMFTCHKCRRNFNVPHGRYPGSFHKCEPPRFTMHPPRVLPCSSPDPAEPGAGYVNQDDPAMPGP